MSIKSSTYKYTLLLFFSTQWKIYNYIFIHLFIYIYKEIYYFNINSDLINFMQSFKIIYINFNKKKDGPIV